MTLSGDCPNCGGQFAELERAGVRIDACRNCRGIWLDRGELEALVKREQRVVASVDDDEEDFVRELTGRKRGEHEDDDHPREQRYGLDTKTAKRIFDDYGSHRKTKKRKSLLDELLG